VESGIKNYPLLYAPTRFLFLGGRMLDVKEFIGGTH
jgi:hypothetical protein